MTRLPAFVLRASLFVLASLAGSTAWAGAGCAARHPSPQQLDAAAATALRAVDALEAADASVALIARVGTDLSKQGLVYSHAGFVLRDHPDGRWTVVHLLNECGSDRSGLYAQGLVDFFSDDLVNQDLRIVWFTPDVARRLSQYLAHMPRGNLHNSHYNLIARPGSRDYQNSTAWLVEVMASAQATRPVKDRVDAYALARAGGFVPDIIGIPYAKRVLGGLFSANVAFTDHPVATRLSGDYPVITVRSIFRFFDKAGYTARVEEWRHGRRMSAPGPA